MSHDLKPIGKPAETEEQQREAKRAALVRNTMYAVALTICIWNTVDVLQAIPWDTRLPNGGRRGRDGPTAPYRLIMPLAVVTMIWWVFRRRPLRTGKYARVRRYLLGAVVPVLVVVGHISTRQALLAEAGVLPG